MKYRLKHLFAVVTFFALACICFCVVRDAVATRTVVSEDLPNGTRIRIIQEFTGEPFNTSIYFDDGDGQWRWYYYDHEDWYWGSADTDYANGVLYVASGNRSVVFDTTTGDCQINGSQLGKKTTEKSSRIASLPAEL